ncbi:MAG TPA: metal-dependent transcriptional regulator [Candidatus Dormibacteraeota bacterium]
MSSGVMVDDQPAHRSEAAERYLEAIYYIEHEGEVPRPGRLAEWLGVSAPTVTVSLQRLSRDGLVRIAADRSVELTDSGAEAAAIIVRRHRIVERWLTDVLGLDWATADLEAQALTHGMSLTVLDRLDEQLGRPLTCPHGNVIPGRTPPAGRTLVRLVDLADGESATVARISEVAEHEAPQLLRILERRGIVPGIELRVVSRADAEWTLQPVGRDAVTVDPGTAHAVWVESPLRVSLG